jgi:hypothetical protein
MQEVLEGCCAAETLSEPVRSAVGLVRALLSDFAQGQTAGGDSWEALFVAAMLIRVACRETDQLLHLPAELLQRCTLSYNFPGNNDAGDSTVLLDNVETRRDFELHADVPLSFPHVAVYYPRHARLHLYDLIVAIHYNRQSRKFFRLSAERGTRGVCEHGRAVRSVCADPHSS